MEAPAEDGEKNSQDRKTVEQRRHRRGHSTHSLESHSEAGRGRSRERIRADPNVISEETGITHIQASRGRPKSQWP